jgi:uncharacterized membrane protein YtjA (UPF0391 family)
MLKWALIFGLASVLTGVVTFSGFAAGQSQAAQALFMLALAAFLFSLFLGLYVIEDAP